MKKLLLIIVLVGLFSCDNTPPLQDAIALEVEEVYSVDTIQSKQKVVVYEDRETNGLLLFDHIVDVTRLKYRSFEEKVFPRDPLVPDVVDERYRSGIVKHVVFMSNDMMSNIYIIQYDGYVVVCLVDLI